MKRFLTFFCLFIYFVNVSAGVEHTPDRLYAKSAVLMDADSGRVLFQKNGKEILSMASTTKIMTCILALEYGDLKDVVTVSKEAEEQPKVHLGMLKGEQFVLEDLLYSLMLESHNDSAVAIAEQISGSVDSFTKLMNQKASEIGCNHTYFLTANGLDALNENGRHSTTASDLAMIMRYCIMQSPKKDEFLKITQTPNYTFSNIKGNRTFQCYNRNTFLTMMEGMISGKTGYTDKAGYCYVGALQRGERTFIVALLACGWPNNKNYRWTDARNLLEYGLENYNYYDVFDEHDLQKVFVKNGISNTENFFEECFVDVELLNENNQNMEVLLNSDEKVDVKISIPDSLEAPIEKGKVIGSVQYKLGGDVIAKYSVITTRDVEKINITYCFSQIIKMYFISE